MRIGGLQKISLLDYPDTICAIIWTVGCNFRCPFCYNRDIVLEKCKIIDQQEIFTFLIKRRKILEGVSITGGEPLLQKEISDFIGKIKEIGFKVKIDTNGAFPDKLENLIKKNLIDYIAMDVKAPKYKYNNLTGVETDISLIERSIDIIKSYDVDYEFRTTIVPGFLKMISMVMVRTRSCSVIGRMLTGWHASMMMGRLSGSIRRLVRIRWEEMCWLSLLLLISTWMVRLRF